MRYFLITGMLLFLLPGLFSQAKTEGHLIVIQDQQVDSLLHHYEALRLKLLENPDHKAIPGYRIQIFFDSGPNSSDRARQAMEQFLLKYPDLRAYVSWKAPNYRVRVGDFRTRLEGERVLQQIMTDYPNAWVIKDEINFPYIN